jgi:peptidoglycan/LPS O-acetylase OafA/YrhL
LDLWRGVACLLVVVYHATYIQCGIATEPSGGATSSVVQWLIGLTHWMDVGVPMFFVISGYCIAAAADGLRHSSRSVGNYFVRRIRRIYPPLWITIISLIVVYLVLDFVLVPGLLSSEPWPQLRPWWYSGWQWVGNFTLTETWRHHIVGDGRGHFPGQAWTLCYEEQFYLATGILLLVSRRWFFLGTALLTAATLVTALTCRWLAVSVAGFFFDGSWAMFAAGILVYYSLRYGTRRFRQASVVLLATAAVVSAVTFPTVEAVSYGFTFGFAVVLLAIHRWDFPLASARVCRPLFFCGTMCYSLYLVHLIPVKAVSQGLRQLGFTSPEATLLLGIPCCLAVCIVLGSLFYLLVERRFLNTWQKAAVSSPGHATKTA